MNQTRARACTVIAVLAFSGPGVHAQSTATSPQPTTTAAPASDMRIERIRVEDGGGRIDELRVRGETQSITVTPKGGLPAYEVAPASANRAPSAGERGSASGGGARVWKVFGF